MGPALIIVRAVLPDRVDYVRYLTTKLPDAVVVQDHYRDAMETFLRALEIAGRRPALHIEDDVVLAWNFRLRVAEAIYVHCNEPIQFFSMRKKDREIGARREPGRTFLMGQCFYLPQDMSRDLRGYADYWRRSDAGQSHPTGLDLMVADFLRERNQRYWIHVPNLVQHRDCKSLINPTRSRSRRSLTFEDRHDV